MKIFVNTQNGLRSIWWIAIFFLVLASLTFPLIILSQHYAFEVTIHLQAITVIAATWICQLLQHEPMSVLFGKFYPSGIKNGLSGVIAGGMLMLIPAMFLTLFGYLDWQRGNGDVSSLLNATGLFLSVALAEEVLFRGFIFYHLRKSTGVWITQILIASYFLLTHMNNPGMTGSTKVLASFNIFTASLMFGLAYIKTGSLIMPVAMHFIANWVQGTLLGFGVSGNEQASLLSPISSDAPQWVTGGSFGLEASVPGLFVVIITMFLLYLQKPALGAQPSTSGHHKEVTVVNHRI